MRSLFNPRSLATVSCFLILCLRHHHHDHHHQVTPPPIIIIILHDARLGLGGVILGRNDTLQQSVQNDTPLICWLDPGPRCARKNRFYCQSPHQSFHRYRQSPNLHLLHDEDVAYDRHCHSSYDDRHHHSHMTMMVMITMMMMTMNNNFDDDDDDSELMMMMMTPNLTKSNSE